MKSFIKIMNKIKFAKMPIANLHDDLKNDMF